jgi:hypothetical protein
MSVRRWPACDESPFSGHTQASPRSAFTVTPSPTWGGHRLFGNLVDSASSHMLVSRIKPCKPESKRSVSWVCERLIKPEMICTVKVGALGFPAIRITSRNAWLIRGRTPLFPFSHWPHGQWWISGAFARYKNQRQQWQRSTDESGQRAKATLGSRDRT